MNLDPNLYSLKELQNDVIVQNHKIQNEYFGKRTSTHIKGCTYSYIEIVNLDNKLGKFKCVRKKINFINNNNEGENTINKYTREIYFLCHLKYLHPNIIKIYGWCDEYILMEYAEHSSLTVMLKNKKFQFTGTQKTKIALGIAHTINYLHKLGINHCDLSLNNILIDEKYEPKICDYGNTKFLSEEPNHIGTTGYIGPEIFPYYNYKINTPQTDVYGFGGILWVLAVGENLPAEKYLPMKESLDVGIIPDKNIRFLIRCCRAYHPSQRYTFDNIIKLIIDGRFVFPETNNEEVNEYYSRLEEETKDPENFDP